MNLLLAVLAWNLFALLLLGRVDLAATAGVQTFFVLFVQINLLLMLFNLIPLGPLDGHYILPYLLPQRAAHAYRYYNARYGTWLLFGVIILQFLGVPVFSILMGRRALAAAADRLFWGVLAHSAVVGYQRRRHRCGDRG